MKICHFMLSSAQGDLTREKVMRARLNPTVLVPACRSSRLTQKVITNLEKEKMRFIRMWDLENLRIWKGKVRDKVTI